jgi:hypothetical protein
MPGACAGQERYGQGCPTIPDGAANLQNLSIFVNPEQLVVVDDHVLGEGGEAALGRCASLGLGRWTAVGHLVALALLADLLHRLAFRPVRSQVILVGADPAALLPGLRSLHHCTSLQCNGVQCKGGVVRAMHAIVQSRYPQVPWHWPERSHVSSFDSQKCYLASIDCDFGRCARHARQVLCHLAGGGVTW